MKCTPAHGNFQLFRVTPPGYLVNLTIRRIGRLVIYYPHAIGIKWNQRECAPRWLGYAGTVSCFVCGCQVGFEVFYSAVRHM